MPETNSGGSDVEARDVGRDFADEHFAGCSGSHDGSHAEAWVLESGCSHHEGREGEWGRRDGGKNESPGGVFLHLALDVFQTLFGEVRFESFFAGAAKVVLVLITVARMSLNALVNSVRSVAV